MRKEYHTKKGLFVAADGVSLEVQPNSLVALLGPSGSGPCAVVSAAAAQTVATWEMPCDRARCAATGTSCLLLVSAPAELEESVGVVSKQGLTQTCISRQDDAAAAHRRPRGAHGWEGLLRRSVPASLHQSPSASCPSTILNLTLTASAAVIVALTPQPDRDPDCAERADVDATDLSVQDRQIGFVFQSYALFNHMTVAQNIAFGIRIRRLPVDQEARCVYSLHFGSNTFAGRLTGALPFMQWYASACMLAGKHKLLPTNADLLYLQLISTVHLSVVQQHDIRLLARTLWLTLARTQTAGYRSCCSW